MNVQEQNVNDYLISTDPEKLNIPFVHNYLSEESYWSKGIPLDVVTRSIKNSLCFAVYKNNSQIAFARIISDYTTFAYLADVFVIEAFRGLGVSKLMMNFIMAHPDLQGLRRFCLGTHDAHGLYERYGFKIIEKPELFMEIKKQNIYLEKK